VGSISARSIALVTLVAAANACAAKIGADVTSPGALGAADGGPPEIPIHDPPLARLNRTEYNNTVRDLLGDATRPADAFPIDPVPSIFDNNAASQIVDELLLEEYESAADRLIETALATSSPARTRILACDLGADATCLPRTLRAFARRAWRRPPTDDEIAALAALSAAASADGDDAETSLKQALKAALVSPNFLYRVELDPTGAAAPHPLDDFELAARLSYFLWSSMPDDQLSDRADQGALADPATYLAEVRRMLDDPKAASLVDNFGSQWLALNKLADPSVTVIDTTVFPEFDEGLRGSMIAETRAYFGAFLREDLDVRDMLVGDLGFLDQRLAALYGLPAPAGGDLARIRVDGVRRFGLLTQASMLTVTSQGYRTSPTRRGKYILARLLCTPPPPPPPKVPALPPESVDPNATIRQRMTAHLHANACVGCHGSMDPMGFAMEHYDGIGRFRDDDEGRPIDATGQLPNGAKFDGLLQLATLLKQDPRLPGCVAKQMFTYALGRDPQSDEQPLLDGLTSDLAASGNRLRALVLALVQSRAFQWRGGMP
jgi:hypothetical protein